MIAHNAPTCGPEEAAAATRVIRSGWLAQGAETLAFENELCDFLGLPAGHAVAVSSGTAALLLALQVLQAKGRRVAFPVYVCSALRNAVAMAGATEVLRDLPDTGANIDPGLAHGSAADLLIAPHMYGIPIDLGARAGIGEIGGIDRAVGTGGIAATGGTGGIAATGGTGGIAATGGMPVIEDCAHALGARVRGVSVGLQGTVGIYSFYATKLMTTGGQGGMLVSRDRALVDAARDYRNFDSRPDRKARFNLQMTDLQAAIGRVQLEKLPYFLSRRAALFAIYRDAGLRLLDIAPDAVGLAPVRYRAVVRTETPAALLQRLARRQIKAIVPIEDWELQGEPSAFPHARRLTMSTVSLPLFPGLSDAQAAMIAACVGDDA